MASCLAESCGGRKFGWNSEVGFIVYLCVRGAHVEDVDTQDQSHNGEGGGHTVSGAHGDRHIGWAE